jgi:hypothetical protein
MVPICTTASLSIYLSLSANAIREQPGRVRICTALDGRGLGCQALVGDGSQAVDTVEVGEGNGFGHQMHAFEVWLAVADDDGKSTGGHTTSLMSMNATSVFSSAPRGALHMPDDLGVYHSQCFHEGTDNSRATSSGFDASSESTVTTASGGGGAKKPSKLPLARGVLHIGANVANEAKGYAACVGGGGGNVLFVECDSDVARECAANARKFGQRCINVRGLEALCWRKGSHGRPELATSAPHPCIA